MTTTYTTRDGDTVDYIAWRYFGSTSSKVTEAVLAQNVGLADHGPILPSGLVITLPDVVTPAMTQGLRLWD